MNNKSYLIFNSQGLQYGIDANLIREIFPLPEITPIAEAPLDFIGILNLRSQIVPVMHLDLRLGAKTASVSLSNYAIALECEGLTIAVIVDEVQEVRVIEPNSIETTLDYGRISHINSVFIAGVVKDENESIILLDSQALIREPDAVKTLAQEGTTEVEFDSRETIRNIGNFYDSYCPNATPAERAIFRQRAESLRKASFEADLEVTEKIPVAVISLGKEYFGIDLDTVREFINIPNYTPIPCCPQHIIGNMNFHGEILTLIDIRTSLNLTPTSVNPDTKAVVIDVDDIVAGLPVDQVLDVMYLHPEIINSVPVALPSGSEAYLKGTVAYQEKTLSLIDLSQLINRGGLEVNEQV